MGRHLLFWFALMVVGIGNGVLREYTYGPFIGDLTAHQISTATAILFAWLAYRPFWDRNPLFLESNTWIVGGIWLLMTVVFEFSFGHDVAGHTWQTLIADYDMTFGRIWPLFLVWIAVMPRFMLWRDSR